MSIIIILFIILCFCFAGNSGKKTSGSRRTQKRAAESTEITYIFSIPDPIESKFFELSEKLANAGLSMQDKIAFCEESLPYLPKVVSQWRKQVGELPPCIRCRDMGPELYMRLGRWKDARRMINTCISCHAYDTAQDGKARIEYLETYQATAETALQFLTENPGFLQRKIYKTLEGKVDLECLKHFTRCSCQIRKEPDGKTNQLYVVSRQYK